MWVGAIKLKVATKDADFAGTDDLIQAVVVRDGSDIAVLNLDLSGVDDNERGDVRSYNFFPLARRNDQTPELPPGIGQNPMPYPDDGLEYSNGLAGHMKIRLRTDGDDMWIKDKVTLSIKQNRQVKTSFDTLAWVRDANWTEIVKWGQDVAISEDSGEGVTSWTMAV
jgi:hypothetical protein